LIVNEREEMKGRESWKKDGLGSRCEVDTVKRQALMFEEGMEEEEEEEEKEKEEEEEEK
jgi:hypothetical protein